MVSLLVDSSVAPAPLFEGTIETLPHEVDGGDGSGTHPCWGPPGTTPAATATGALDDALRTAGISWRGKWDPSFRDFFVDRIGPYASAAPDSYWSLTVNGGFSAGGCLTRVADGDAVRFHYGPLFGTPPGPGGETVGSTGEQQGDGVHGKDPAGAGGPGPPSRRFRRVAAKATAYLRRSRGAGEVWARLALAVRRGNGPGHAAAELLTGRLGGQRRDGSLGGDVNSTAVAVLALEIEQPRAAARAAAWLAGRQAASGGFGYRPGAPADVDTTGLATWALAVAGREPAAMRSALFILPATARRDLQLAEHRARHGRPSGDRDRPPPDDRRGRPRPARLPGLALPPRRLDPLRRGPFPHPGMEHRAGAAGVDEEGEAARLGPRPGIRLNTLPGPRLRWRDPT
jgi:hypothetical protein